MPAPHTQHQATHATTTAPSAQPVQVVGMWDQEAEHPLLYACLYAIAMLTGLLGHHVVGWMALLWGGA